ncbi:MAG: T9SS type A sorting domain-containing protein, partial [Bacteroidetes bacterium]|nr:T9SS type A sorting domain-containing protein [Bacteroidota bacterium]
SGNVGTTSDADWYYFDVSTAGNINVTLNIGSSADLDFFLYNSSLTEVARGYTVNNPEVANYNASTGRYYVMVNGYSGATSAYTLTVNGGLAQIARGGEKTDLLPDKLTLKQNFPNPFNPTTTISYFLPEEGLTVLKIYNVMGQEVRTLYNGHRKAGLYHEVWDGRSNSGAVVSSGIYIYRLQAGATILSRKMLFQK